MDKLDYESIVDRIIRLKSDELNEKESGFLDNIYMNNKFPYLTGPQKKWILDIQRKYIIDR